MSEPLHLDLAAFEDPDLAPEYVAYLVRDEAPARSLHFERLWAYYRNPLTPLGAGLAPAAQYDDWTASARPYVQAQEFGLPGRITGRSHLGYGGAAVPVPGLSRKEVVIENDIGWRIDAAVHFLAGGPVGMESLAARPERARRIEATLAEVWPAGLLHEVALLGAVYGSVDLVVRTRPGAAGGAGRVEVEPVEAPRVLPVLDEDDGRTLRYWIQVARRETRRMTSPGAGRTPLDRFVRRDPPSAPETVEVVEILGPRWWQRYEAGRLAAEGANPLGRVPVVHVQNLADPMRYDGMSEVEPLIPLQDELNTRLSDRANRVTFQSFKMYLSKGLEGFEDQPIAPGRMWSTDNPNASIEAFGGDADSPGETAHIAELREAMDKVSAVTPLAAGLLRDRVGNLTSAAALRVVLSGTLARLARKRTSYGAGLVAANRLVLEALDRLGGLRTDPADRATRLHWPTPLPEDLAQDLANARLKRELGVPAATVLRELGYDPTS